MKLAEALLLRSDQQKKKIISLKQRINANVLVQDGDQPSEDPNELLKQVFSLIQEFQKLSYAIHETNALTKLNDGRSLLALLTLRDEFVEQHKTLTAAISNTSRESDRYSTREKIKWHKVIPVSSLQKQADDISLKLRDLNVLIQSTNWKIDLIEA
jgi:hypothetical protein